MKTVVSSVAFQGPDGTVAANGRLLLSLSQNAMITAGGGQVYSNIPIVIDLDATGKIPAATQIFANDELTPAGTTYLANLQDKFGTRLDTLGTWSIAGASPIDLSLMVPTSSAISFPNPVLLSPAGTQTIVQPTGTSLNVNRFENIRFADQFAGADIGAKINAAITDLGANGGLIVIPAGSYSFSTQIVLDSKRSVIIQGQGGMSAGAACATSLTWTGSGTTPAISAADSLGCSLRDFQLIYSSGTFTGILIKADGAANTAYFTIYDCSISGSAVTSAAVLIGLDKAQSCLIKNCRFGGCAVAIRGAATNGSFSNSNELLSCTFSDSTGTIATAMIQNATQGWNIAGCTFELGQAAGVCKILDYTGTLTGQGINFIGNWAGDDNASVARTLFNWAVIAGQFSGNYVAANGTNTTVFNLPASSFIDASGNTFATALVLFALGANVRINAGVNTYSSIGSFLTGTPLSGYVFDNTDSWTVYGKQTWSGSTTSKFSGTPLTLNNSADAEFDFDIQAGSSADQNTAIRFRDKSGTIQQTIRKNNSNQLEALDNGSITRLLIATAGGTILNSGNAASRVTINGSVNTGTAGFAVASGGASPANVWLVDGSGITTQQTANAAQWIQGNISELLTLSTVGTTTDTSANLLPANSIIESVVARITTTITTATDWKLGDATQAARFTSANATMTAGTTTVGLNQADPTVASANLGPVQVSAAKVRVTTTGTPGAGVIRITVFYRQFVPPTS